MLQLACWLRSRLARPSAAASGRGRGSLKAKVEGGTQALHSTGCHAQSSAGKGTAAGSGEPVRPGVALAIHGGRWVVGKGGHCGGRRGGWAVQRHSMPPLAAAGCDGLARLRQLSCIMDAGCECSQWVHQVGQVARLEQMAARQGGGSRLGAPAARRSSSSHPPAMVATRRGATGLGSGGAAGEQVCGGRGVGNICSSTREQQLDRGHCRGALHPPATAAGTATALAWKTRSIAPGGSLVSPRLTCRSGATAGCWGVQGACDGAGVWREHLGLVPALDRTKCKGKPPKAGQQHRAAPGQWSTARWCPAQSCHARRAFQPVPRVRAVQLSVSSSSEVL